MRVMVSVTEICTFLVQFLHVGKMWGKKTEKNLVECILRGFFVPGAGIEPARIAPLVFETSASTDSAIRAGVLSGCLWARASQEAGA